MGSLHAQLFACPLFEGIEGQELTALLDCLGAQQKSYPKNSFIFRTEEEVSWVGVVLTGCVHVIKEDFWGRRMILARLEPGDLFGETFSCAQVDKLPVDAVAAEPSTVLLIDYRRLTTGCAVSCAYHGDLIRNMLRIVAEKNVLLMQKIEYVTRPTTREKLLSYLSGQAQKQGSRAFKIPFNRQELADYLSVERSAMSGELGRMRDEGLIRFHKSEFELLAGSAPKG